MPDPRAIVPDTMSDEESKALRQAFGQFATGVTIVTTSDSGHDPVGVTANSFSSVSLQPPMVLWSLSAAAMSRRVFEKAEYFCVHILSAAQQELSDLFAQQGADKFAVADWSWGEHGVPLLNDFAARFHCRTESQLPVGDHIVIVGEVIKFEKTDQRPLVFHGGQYALAERRMMQDVARRVRGRRRTD